MNDAATVRLDLPDQRTPDPLDIDTLAGRFRDRAAKIGVIGLGYVGLPLLRTAAERGFSTLGCDIDHAKVEHVIGGGSSLAHISPESIAAVRRSGHLAATDDFSRLGEVDAIILCVPTPLTRQREPDLSFIVSTTEAVALHLRRGQLVVLESTTFPGPTREVMRPILERSGLRSGNDFFLPYSPQRDAPANPHFATPHIATAVLGDP